MAEWTILLLLVPAVVVPVVMFLGFAGCKLDREPLVSADPLPSMPTPPIINVSCQDSTILVSWTYSGAGAVDFIVERSPEWRGGVVQMSAGPRSQFEDSDVTYGLSYRYRVAAVFGTGEVSRWSNDATVVCPPPPRFDRTFTAGYLDQPSDGWRGYTLVQRIEPGLDRLTRSGRQVQLILRASRNGDVRIDRIFISQPNPAGDPYDSGADLTEVPIPGPLPYFDVPAREFRPFIVDYALEAGQPLLIAVDFSVDHDSGVGSSTAVPPEEAVAYYQNTRAEAMVQNRTEAYTRFEGLYLIEAIEVR